MRQRDCRQFFGGFVLQILLAFVQTDGEIPQLYFLTEPSSVTAERGENFLLPCSVAGEPPINITWRHGDQELTDTTGLVSVQPNGSLWLRRSEEMAWSPPTAGDRYQCCATNHYGTLCSRTVLVTAYDNHPALDQPHVIPQQQEAINSGTARLQCVTGSHTAEWQKDGETLQLDNERYTMLPNGVLQISPVEQDDAGNYRCIVRTNSETITSNASRTNSSDTMTSNASRIIVVESAGTGPQPAGSLIVKGPGDITVDNPEAVILECLPSTSSVVITWSRAGSKTLPSNRSFSLGLGNLKLVDPTTEDSGEYICTATDPETGNNTTSSAWLNITQYYLPQITTYPESMVKKDFGTVRFHCVADGNPPPRITWYRNGEPVVLSRFIKQRPDNDLLIYDVDEDEHQGIYQCFASNAVGTTQASALLQVYLSTGQRPSPPYNVTARAVGSDSVFLDWMADEEVFVFVLYYYSEPDGELLQKVSVDSSYERRYLVSGLLPFTNYTFQIRAITTVASKLSGSVLCQTEGGVPLVFPVFSVLNDTATSVTVAWEPLTDTTLTQGRIITYQVCYQEGGLEQCTCREVGSDQTDLTVSNLRAGTVYDIYMAAATKAGFGPESDRQVVTMMNKANCSAPPLFSLDIIPVLNSPQVRLVWYEESSVGSTVSPVLGFQLYLPRVLMAQSGSTNNKINISAKTREYVLPRLVTGSTYTFELIPYNECGRGPVSTKILTFASSDSSVEPNIFFAPENVRAVVLTSTIIQVNWDPILTLPNPNYQIRYQPVDDVYRTPMTYLTTNIFVELKDLLPFTTYKISVRLLQDDILSQYSQSVNCTTKEDVPSAPTDFSAEPVDAHSVSVAWSPPAKPNGRIKAYTIMFVPDQPEGNLEQHWNKTQKKGSETSSTVSNLTSDTRYYFVLRASTSVGEGEPSQVLEVKTLQEYLVQTDGKFKISAASDAEKGLFVGIILGSFCILICTIAFGIRYKYKVVQQRSLVHHRRNQAMMPHHGMTMIEMATIQPMLSHGEATDRSGLPVNAVIHCDSTMLGGDPTLAMLSPRRQGTTGGAGTATTSDVVGARSAASLRREHPSTAARPPTSPSCSASLPESGTEDGPESMTGVWRPLRQSTSGDSGLIGDLDLSGEEPRVDFVENVPRKNHVGVHQV